MRKIVFWGAGKTAKYILEFWKLHDVYPDFFCDNDRELWGKEIDGIRILCFEELYMLGDITVYITCRFFDEVMEQLVQQGISAKQIVRAESIRAPEMLYRISEKLLGNIKLNFHQFKKDKCLIDLSGGMVLGGVERWSYSLTDVLQRIGIDGFYLVPEHIQNTVVDYGFPAIFISAHKKLNENYFLDACIRSIVDSKCKIIICNFPFEIFEAACIVKKHLLPNLHIIAVVHNDEEIYYRSYCVWKEYIDECLVISKRMKNALIERGFPTEKIKELYWKIPCKEVPDRSYSYPGEPLHIGYAGRLRKKQKRLDLIIDIAEKLRERKINYLLEIAGIGDYEDVLQREVFSRNLNSYIKFKGFIEHENILQFWEKQDIYLNCSDWEGHSISQSEAMAAGAVPVATNTSGTEDDIRHGYNGYLVELQDVDGIVRWIEYLYNNREFLPIMGIRCYDIVVKRNESINEEVFWKKIFCPASVIH